VRSRRQSASLLDQMQRDALVSGLGDARPPTLRTVERRRVELWLVATFALVALSVALVLPSLWPSLPQPFTSFTPTEARGIVLVLMVALFAYMAEKGIALRRLRTLLRAEQANIAHLETEVDQLSTLLAVGKAMNSELALRDVLAVILQNAVEFVRAMGGSIMLAEGPDHLRVVCTLSNDAARGARLWVGHGLAGRVAAFREPVLTAGPFDPGEFDPSAWPAGAISVPLISRGELLGVLTVFSPERQFDQTDLRSMTLFAEHAAISIVNAHHYETERRRVAELQDTGRS
jgi:two-component system sensor histidine kinase KdpD